MYQEGILSKFEFTAKFWVLFEYESRTADLSSVPGELPPDQLEMIREIVSQAPTHDEKWAAFTMLTIYPKRSYANDEACLSQAQREYFRFVDTWRRIDPESVHSPTDSSDGLVETPDYSSFGSFDDDDTTDQGLEDLISKLGCGLFANCQFIECLVTMFEDSYNGPTLGKFAHTLPPRAIAVIIEYIEGCPRSSEEWAAFRLGSKCWVRHKTDVSPNDEASHFYRFVIAWRLYQLLWVIGKS